MRPFLNSLFVLAVVMTASAVYAQGFRAQPVARLLKFRTANAEVNTKSYREWKGEKLQAIQNRISNIQARIEITKQGRTIQGDPNLAMPKGTEANYLSETSASVLEKQLQQEQYAMELAQDLSVTDYFVGYLSKVTNQQKAVYEVASRLSVDEVAELMFAYSKMFSSQASEASTKP